MRASYLRAAYRAAAAVFCAARMVCCECAPARADRTVLGPAGATLDEHSYLAEFAASSSGTAGDYDWLAYSSGDGIEMEVSRFEAPTERNKRWALGIEYPMPTLKNLPAISFGVRDILGTGVEHGALYAAATSSIPLSRAQRSLLHSLEISVGAGTGTIGGAFVGVRGRLPFGLVASAEVYRHRPNFSLGLPLLKNLDIKAYSLNGSFFYGISYNFVK